MLRRLYPAALMLSAFASLASCGGDDSSQPPADGSAPAEGGSHDATADHASPADSAIPDAGHDSAQPDSAQPDSAQPDAAKDANAADASDASDAATDAAIDAPVDAPADTSVDEAGLDGSIVPGPLVFRGAFVGGGAGTGASGIRFSGVFVWQGAVQGQNNDVRIQGWLR